ncbi:hypothetical protein [Paenibacillus sp. sgz302251]|uniref:hypothetical protein n=1 Tax=Paenibacillus sp. sgz302251 TaxID=3414493 RepID=UPI003C7EAD0B
MEHDCKELPQSLRCTYCQRKAKPPIGIIPRYLWDKQRAVGLKEAIERYINEGFPVPPEWIEEYNELISKRNW